MRHGRFTWLGIAVVFTAALGVACAQDKAKEGQAEKSDEAPQAASAAEGAGRQAPPRGKTSYMPVVAPEFKSVLERMSREKPQVMKRQMTLLEERYDLSDRPSRDAKMSRGKPLQEGVR